MRWWQAWPLPPPICSLCLGVRYRWGAEERSPHHCHWAGDVCLVTLVNGFQSSPSPFCIQIHGSAWSVLPWGSRQHHSLPPLTVHTKTLRADNHHINGLNRQHSLNQNRWTQCLSREGQKNNSLFHLSAWQKTPGTSSLNRHPQNAMKKTRFSHI